MPNCSNHYNQDSTTSLISIVDLQFVYFIVRVDQTCLRFFWSWCWPINQPLITWTISQNHHYYFEATFYFQSWSTRERLWSSTNHSLLFLNTNCIVRETRKSLLSILEGLRDAHQFWIQQYDVDPRGGTWPSFHSKMWYNNRHGLT